MFISFNCAYSNKTPFEGLKENLRLGEKVLKEFNKEFPVLNKPSLLKLRLDSFEKKHPDNKLSEDLMRKLVSDVQKLRADRKEKHIIAKLYNDIAIPTRNLVKVSKVANCQECADIVRLKLRNTDINVQNIGFDILNKFTKMSIPEKNHIFTVIGMKDNAIPTIPATWGNEAVIIDAWRGIVSKANEAMNDYKLLFKFNPNEEKMFFLT